MTRPSFLASKKSENVEASSRVNEFVNGELHDGTKTRWNVDV